ncbi:MAG: OB-fold domain-containing protein [Myxococcota bacterium]|nr:OB-fold domain-containing protein [Myxococcota bacterium]
MAGSREGTEALTAPHTLEYTYKRSVGPVMGAFFTALREQRILGVRRADGSVLCPPREYDPDTGEALSEMVPVQSEGEVLTWAWVAAPREKQPLDRPFAYALIRLDGADTPLLHAVDAGSPEAMKTGMRVRAVFAPEPAGGITDIACFEPA